ncbi:MAG: hypothetical protein HYU66_07950 [Armatimonadetes bacterium]|nr:hypothetical protein [Armatimonadota bacterium]
MLHRWLMVALCLAVHMAAAQDLDLLGPDCQWSAGIDNGGTQMTLLPPTAEVPLAVRIVADGGNEDYPKLRLLWPEPQDFSRYARFKVKLRVTDDAPTARDRVANFVFYDDQTRLADYPGHPMKQQRVAERIPVGRWVELRGWLQGVTRATIRQLDLYLYELPPATAHTYTWEFAELRIEGLGEVGSVFDSETYGKQELAAPPPGGSAGKVGTRDGLQLDLAGNGAVRSVSLDGKAVGAAAGHPTGLLVRNAAAGGPPVRVGGTLTKRGTTLVQTATVKPLALRVEATYRSAGDYLEIAGKVIDQQGADRAVTVYFALPLSTAEWQWWDSVSVSHTQPAERGECSYVETGVGYGQNGLHSVYPLGAVTLPGWAGLSLAVRMDEPVVHRLAYNPALHLFYVALDFGLVPEQNVHGRPLSEAPFRILLYRHDPVWGFRSALQRYYGFFPDWFTVRTPRQGGWFVWGDMSKMEGALEAGFGFHWGPSGADAVKWDNEHGITALQYILKGVAAGSEEELAKYEKLGYASYTPGRWLKDHSRREMLQTVSRACEASVQYDVAQQPYGMVGQYSWMSESKWGVILPCDLDPDIPQGKGWFCREPYLESGLLEMQEAGAHFDGIGLDSLGGYGQYARVDYRREHFRYADVPLSFSSREHEPVLVSAFATVEWVRKLAADMHGRKLVLMANCSWGNTPAWLTFAAPYLDVFGAEAPRFADPDFARAIAYRKVCTDLPYEPRPDWEVARNQLWGIYPGHGNKPEVMARFAQTFRDLAAAGWEPVTQARLTPGSVRLERYGNAKPYFLVLHNPSDQPVEASVRLAVAATAVTRLLDKMQMPAPGKGFKVSLGGQETVVLAVR